MVFYSKKSNEKVFHLPHCKIVRRIRKEYKMQFDTPEEARAAGYRMCNCCSVVGVRLRKEQREVEQFCRENGLTFKLKDGQLYVRTHRSKWCIIANGKTNKLFLYHKNTQPRKDRIVSIVPGYHSQAIRHESIMGYLDYIVQHDDFRKCEQEQAKKKTRSHHDLRKNTRQYQRGTTKRSFNAGQMYSILDGLIL